MGWNGGSKVRHDFDCNVSRRTPRAPLGESVKVNARYDTTTPTLPSTLRSMLDSHYTNWVNYTFQNHTHSSAHLWQTSLSHGIDEAELYSNRNRLGKSRGSFTRLQVDPKGLELATTYCKVMNSYVIAFILPPVSSFDGHPKLKEDRVFIKSTCLKWQTGEQRLDHNFILQLNETIA